MTTLIDRPDTGRPDTTRQPSPHPNTGSRLFEWAISGWGWITTAAMGAGLGALIAWVAS